MLAGGGLFFLRLPNDGVISTGQLIVAIAPYQAACLALLVLFWIGPFPESWPIVGGSKAAGGFMFWVVAAMMALLWATFYAAFVFEIL
jgi:hypothetical protein